MHVRARPEDAANSPSDAHQATSEERSAGPIKAVRARRYLYSAQLVSAVGSKISAVAIPTLAVLSLGAGATGAALLFASEYLPGAVAAPMLGVVADRLRKFKHGMVGADAGRAVALLSLPVAASLNVLTLAQLYVVAGVVGALNALFGSCSQAIVPKLIDRGRLASANAVAAGTGATGDLAGPAIGGVLVGLLGAASAISADVFSYVASALLLGRLPEPEQPTVRAAPSSVRSDLTSGWSYLRSEPLLVRLLAGAAVLNLAGSGIGGLYVYYAYARLRLTPQLLGLNYSVGAATGLIAAVLAPRVIARLGMRSSTTWGAGACAVALFLIPAASSGPGFAFLTAYQLLFTASATIWSICLVTARQEITPAHLLGRVNALSQSALLATMPLGALVAALLARVVGVVPTLLTMSCVACCAVLPYLRKSAWAPAVVTVRASS